MTINVCACLIVLLGSFIGLDSPLTVTQMLWVNLIMDTFAAMALSSLPADRKVLYDKPRDPNSHIVDRKMVRQIFASGLFFFFILAGLWQLLGHTNISEVQDLLSYDVSGILLSNMFEFESNNLSAYDHGVFFSIFVMMQFWNLFNAKYFRTNRSLLQDFAGLFADSKRVRSSYSSGFWWILLVILIGQVLIVTYGGAMFNVQSLSFADWGWIILITSPILIVPDILRCVSNAILRKAQNK